MTDYQIFLCIIGAISVGYSVLSIRSSLQTRRACIGEPPFEHVSRSPLLFWLSIVSRVVVAAVIAAAILIAIFRR